MVAKMTNVKHVFGWWKDDAKDQDIVWPVNVYL